MTKISPRTTYAQFLAMVEFMEKNGDLSRSPNLPRGIRCGVTNCIRCGVTKWRELTDLLNNLGSQKSSFKPRTEEKWRKVWSDFKNYTKRKWFKISAGEDVKMCLMDLEYRVLSIMGIQAIGIPLAEVGLGMAEDSIEEDKTDSVPGEIQAEDVIIIKLPEIPIVGDEDWNIPGSSKDPGTILPGLRSTSPPISTTPHKFTSPSMSPIASQNETSPQSPLQQKRKRTLSDILEEYANKCDENIRENKSDEELTFLHIERERIRQRDIELRQRDTELLLQAQWLEFMKAGLNVLERYLNSK